jgi:AbrB family looped-hinge helix DNA binding protein
MAIITIKDKFQVVIPQSVRKEVRLSVGDLLEATAENGAIVLKPKAIVDRDLVEGLADLKAGRVRGPFKSGAAAARFLQVRSATKPGNRQKK